MKQLLENATSVVATRDENVASGKQHTTDPNLALDAQFLTSYRNARNIQANSEVSQKEKEQALMNQRFESVKQFGENMFLGFQRAISFLDIFFFLKSKCKCMIIIALLITS